MRIVLTDKGEETHITANEVQVIERTLSCLSGEQLETLNSCLETLLSSILDDLGLKWDFFYPVS